MDVPDSGSPTARRPSGLGGERQPAQHVLAVVVLKRTDWNLTLTDRSVPGRAGPGRLDWARVLIRSGPRRPPGRRRPRLRHLQSDEIDGVEQNATKVPSLMSLVATRPTVSTDTMGALQATPVRLSQRHSDLCTHTSGGVGAGHPVPTASGRHLDLGCIWDPGSSPRPWPRQRDESRLASRYAMIITR